MLFNPFFCLIFLHMFVDAVLHSPLRLFTLQPMLPALGCHIRKEVNRQASAAVTHTTDESFAAVEVKVAQSIPTQPYSLTLSALAAVETTLLSQLSAYLHFFPVNLQLRYNNSKAGENRSSSLPSVCIFLGFTCKASHGAVKCFSRTSSDIQKIKARLHSGRFSRYYGIWTQRDCFTHVNKL